MPTESIPQNVYRCLGKKLPTYNYYLVKTVAIPCERFISLFVLIEKHRLENGSFELLPHADTFQTSPFIIKRAVVTVCSLLWMFVSIKEILVSKIDTK